MPQDRDAALGFGIPEAKIDEFMKWCTTDAQSSIEFLSMFYSVDAARRYAERFLPNTNDLYLIGVGLPKMLFTPNWHEIIPPPPPEYEIDIEINLLLQPAPPQREETEPFGIEKQIEQRLPLAEGGIALGYEVVSFAYNDFGHSWYCNHTAEDLGELFGIRPGQYGLIDTREAAQQVYDWIAEDNQQGHRGEPEPYDYWLLVSYPLRVA
jgi:hypothetical protein